MRTKICSVALLIAMAFMLAPKSVAKDAKAQVFKEQEQYTLSLELKFARKSQGPLQRVISFLLDSGPNGHATGFLVGDGLVMTAYHVVSGELSASKKMILGFAPDDQLDVKVFVNGRQATVIRVDKDADLALLVIENSRKLTSSGSRKRTRTPAFQNIATDKEKLYLIARPHGAKIVSEGILHGSYAWRGLEYFSVKIENRAGFSGSPVYNQRAEVVGIFSGYDSSQKLAIISPGTRAQKLLEDYVSNSNP